MWQRTSCVYAHTFAGAKSARGATFIGRGLPQAARFMLQGSPGCHHRAVVGTLGGRGIKSPKGEQATYSGKTGVVEDGPSDSFGHHVVREHRMRSPNRRRFPNEKKVPEQSQYSGYIRKGFDRLADVSA